MEHKSRDTAEPAAERRKPPAPRVDDRRRQAGRLSSVDVVRLQRTVGNAATASLLGRPAPQQAAAAVVQREPGAAAPYTAKDVSRRTTLALREARWEATEAEHAMDRLIDSQTEAEENRRFDKSAYRMHLRNTATHITMIGDLLAGVTDLKPFAADAAAVLAPVTQLVEYGDSHGFGAGAEVKALQPYVASLTRWAGAAKPPAKPRTSTREERDQGIVLALRAVRATCDDVMAGEPPDPGRVAAAAPLVSRDLAYARGLTPGKDNAEDVDLASRGVGRMLAWVAEQNQAGAAKAPVRPAAGWDYAVERDVDVMRKWAGLKPDGWKSDVVKGRLVAPDAERPDKNATQQALNEWNNDSLDTIEAVRRWITNNWIAFIGATSQNPRLSWDAGVFDQAASNLVGNLLTELGKNVIQKGSAAIAGALIGSFAGPVGTVIGFVIGLLVETIASVVYSYLFDDTAEKIDQAGRDASARTGKQAEAKHEEFSNAADAGRTQQRKAFDAVQKNLAGAGSKAKVDAIGEELRRDKPAVAGARNNGDRSLYTSMLHDWVLEHAGDEEDADKDTSEAQWETARAESFGKGDLKNRKDLWAYQTRAAWIEAGFDPAVVGRATDAYITTSNKEGVDPEDKYHGQVCYLPVVTSPEAFFNYLVRNKAAVAREDYDYIKQDPAKNVKATCEFDLTTADGTTYVDEWNWTVELLGRPARWRTKKVTFDVEPD